MQRNTKYILKFSLSEAITNGGITANIIQDEEMKEEKEYREKCRKMDKQVADKLGLKMQQTKWSGTYLDYDDPDYLQSIYDDLDKLNSFDEFKDETNAGKNFKRIGGGQYHNALLNYIRFDKKCKHSYKSFVFFILYFT